MKINGEVTKNVLKENLIHVKNAIKYTAFILN